MVIGVIRGLYHYGVGATVVRAQDDTHFQATPKIGIEPILRKTSIARYQLECTKAVS